MVVCYKCHSIYDYSECVEGRGTTKHSRKCIDQEHKNSSRKYEQLLLKTVEFQEEKHCCVLLKYTAIEVLLTP